MWDLWTNKIYGIPEEPFKGSERLYLGDIENWQAVLCFRDWEFRIYTYDYDEDDETGRDNRDLLSNEFENFFWSYERDTLGYVAVENSNEDELLSIITNVCNENLGYFSPFAKDELPWFIRKRIGKANKYIKVYSYYK